MPDRQIRRESVATRGWSTAGRFIIGAGFSLLGLALVLFLNQPTARATDYSCLASFRGTPPPANTTYPSETSFLAAWGRAVTGGWKVDASYCLNGAPSTNGSSTFYVNGKTIGSLPPTAGSFTATYAAKVCVPAGVANPCFTASQYSGAGSMSGGPYTISPPASSGGSSSTGSSTTSGGSTGGGVTVSAGSAAVSAACISADSVTSGSDCTVYSGDAATIHYTSQNTPAVWIQVDSNNPVNLGHVDGNYSTGAIRGTLYYTFAVYDSGSRTYKWTPWITVHVIAAPPSPATTGQISLPTASVNACDTYGLNVKVTANGPYSVIGSGNYTGLVGASQVASPAGASFFLSLSDKQPNTETLTLKSSDGTELDSQLVRITHNCPSVSLTVNGQHPQGWTNPVTAPAGTVFTLAWTVANVSHCTAYTERQSSQITDQIGRQWSGQIAPASGTKQISQSGANPSALPYAFVLQCGDGKNLATDYVAVQINPTAAPSVTSSASSSPSSSATRFAQTGTYISPKLTPAAGERFSRLTILQQTAPKNTTVTYRYSTDKKDWQPFPDANAPVNGAGTGTGLKTFALANLTGVAAGNPLYLRIDLTGDGMSSPSVRGIELSSEPLPVAAASHAPAASAPGQASQPATEPAETTSSSTVTPLATATAPASTTGTTISTTAGAAAGTPSTSPLSFSQALRDYHYAYVSQTRPGPLQAGQSAEFSLTIRNTGQTAWSNQTVHLGTDRDQDRIPEFIRDDLVNHHPSGWASPNRVKMEETSVAPGQTATFDFWYTVPANLKAGVYREYFRPVADGIGWLDDFGIYWDVTVGGGKAVSSSPADYQAAWVSQSAYPTLTIGQAHEFEVTVRNIGTATWQQSSVHLGTDRPQDHIPFYIRADDVQHHPSGWVSPNRVELDQSSVAPGQIGTFRFWYTVPSNAKPGTYREYFRPVADGITWMNDLGIYWDVTIAQSN